MLPFDQLMRDLAAYLRTELGCERDIYSLTVPLPAGRNQEICAAVRPAEDGREVIDFVSTVGKLHRGIDPWRLLQANHETTFSRVAVTRQMIFVVASQLLATAQPEEVLLMLREVAMLADRLEREFFGNDAF